MNRQVHSTTGKILYEIVFKQRMPDRPRMSTFQRSTHAVIEQQHDIQGLPITLPNTLLELSITLSIDPLVSNSGEAWMVQTTTFAIPSILVIKSEAVQSLNDEVIAHTPEKVIAMEKRYNKVNKVEVFETGDHV
jgi:hypothetical protein